MVENLNSAHLPLSAWYEDDLHILEPAHADNADAVPTTVQSRKRRLSEAAEDYPDVIAKLNMEWRIILCRDGIQWILQRHTGGRWRSLSYCRTRDGLLRCIRDAGIPSDVVEGSALSELPERI